MIVWRTAFLIALPKKGTIAGAARVARVSRRTVYNLMAAEPAFDARVRAIIASYDRDRIADRERQARYQLQATA